MASTGSSVSVVVRIVCIVVSSGQLPAVDEQGDASDEGRAGAAEPQHDGGDLLRRPEPSERDRRGGGVAVEVPGDDHVVDHRGVDRPRTYGVDADAEGAELLRRALGQA